MKRHKIKHWLIWLKQYRSKTSNTWSWKTGALWWWIFTHMALQILGSLPSQYLFGNSSAYISSTNQPFLRINLWWSSCSLYLLACQVRSPLAVQVFAPVFMWRLSGANLSIICWLGQALWASFCVRLWQITLRPGIIVNNCVFRNYAEPVSKAKDYVWPWIQNWFCLMLVHTCVAECA